MYTDSGSPLYHIPTSLYEYVRVPTFKFTMLAIMPTPPRMTLSEDLKSSSVSVRCGNKEENSQ